MTNDDEKFVSRWSRLKREARDRADKPESREAASPADPRAPTPDVPPLDKLDFDSDYRGFFHPKIDEDTRRAALKRLFSDPRFNVIDDMDIDIEDYSKYAPLSAAVVASLKQTQNILQWAREREEEEKRRSEERTRIAENQPGPENTEPAPARSGSTNAAGEPLSRPLDEGSGEAPGAPDPESRKA